MTNLTVETSPLPEVSKVICPSLQLARCKVDFDDDDFFFVNFCDHCFLMMMMTNVRMVVTMMVILDEVMSTVMTMVMKTTRITMTFIMMSYEK